jgi:hypothetical protein
VFSPVLERRRTRELHADSGRESGPKVYIYLSIIICEEHIIWVWVHLVCVV